MSGQISIGNKNIEKCFLGEDKVVAVYYGDSLVYQGFTVEDKIPYNFRKSGGSGEIGNKEIDKVVGGTIVWNQLVQNGNFEDSSTWNTINTTLSIGNNVATFTRTDLTNVGRITANNGVSQPYIANHKYLFTVDIKVPALTSNNIALRYAAINIAFFNKSFK